MKNKKFSAAILLALSLGLGHVTSALAQDEVETSGATVVYGGETYALEIFGSCGAATGASYNTWAITPDEEGTPSPDTPRLHAYSSGEWSRFEFYVDGPTPKANLYFEGDKMVPFSDGTLNYEGPAAEGSTDTISIAINCSQP